MSEPSEVLHSLKSFQRDFPDPLKVAFLMMQFGDTPAHHEITDAIRKIFALHGITVVRADDSIYNDDLFLNVITYLHGCGFSIALFERIETEAFNPNVSLEIGYAMALGKPVCILKDRTIRTMPSDLIGRLYINFDPQRPLESLRDEIPKWLRIKKLIRSPYRCSITISRSIYGWDTEALHQIANGLSMLVPNVEPKFCGIKKSDSGANATIDFEADDRFFSHLKKMKESGELSRLTGIEILDVCGERLEDALPEINLLVQDLKAEDGRCVMQVCMLSSIEGCDAEPAEAKRVLPECTTNAVDECCIYLTEHQGLLYCHSNYVRPGFVYPTKVLVQDMVGLRNILPVIVGRNPGDLYKDDKLVLAHVMHVRYLVNTRLCSDNKRPSFDLHGATRVEFVTF